MADKTLTPLTNAEMQAFCSQMSMILKSGISSTEGLSIMLDDARNTEEQKFLKTALDTLNMTRKPLRSDESHRCMSGLFYIHDPDWRTDRYFGRCYEFSF